MGSFPEGAVLPRELHKRHKVDCRDCANSISRLFSGLLALTLLNLSGNINFIYSLSQSM